MGSVAPSPFVMHVERDLKLAVPDGFRMPSLAKLGPLRRERPRRATTTFYDSEDLSLAAWGALLRYRTREGWTVKLPDRGAGDGLERAEQAFAGRDGEPPAAALRLLAPFLRGRSVAPVARMSTVRRRIAMGDADKTLLDVVDDRVSSDDTGSRQMRQIEIELRDPSAVGLRDDVARALAQAGAQPGDRTTKYAWVLGERLPPPEILVAKVRRASTAADAVRAALAADVVAFMRQDAEIRAGHDPEAVHQARVAVRRLRSDLRAFTSLVDSAWSRMLRAELDWVGQTLGAVRDRQVLALRMRGAGNGEAALRPVLGILDDEIARARQDLDTAMSSERYLRLLDQLVDAARAPRVAVDGPAGELLRPAVERAWRRLRRAARRARQDADAEDLHPVRIEAKRVRYTCEALAPLFGKRAMRLASAANKLQDVLGEHQDALVARDWFRAHIEADGAVTAFALGELAAAQIAVRDDARGRWVAAWKKVRRWRPGRWR